MDGLWERLINILLKQWSEGLFVVKPVLLTIYILFIVFAFFGFLNATLVICCKLSKLKNNII
jgi:hypothetical protein